MTKSFEQQGKERYVYRREDTLSWIVNVYHCGATLGAKTFSDYKYGGIDSSFRAAVTYRDELLIKNCKKLVSGHVKKRECNTSGTIGVFRELIEGRPYWTASCYIGLKKRKYVRFSINKLGEDRAEQMAIAKRTEYLQAIRQGKDGERTD